MYMYLQLGNGNYMSLELNYIFIINEFIFAMQHLN